MALSTAEAPSLVRRLACLVYETLLVLAIVMLAGLLYGGLTQQRHALVGTAGLQAVLFVVMGVYFTWSWSLGRQTLAMKTWRLRIVTRDGRPLSQARALARYLASWLWCLPALAGLGLAGVRSGAAIAWALIGGVLAYALLARLTPSRQYLHDLICGTRLETWARPRPGPLGQKSAP